MINEKTANTLDKICNVILHTSSITLAVDAVYHIHQGISSGDKSKYIRAGVELLMPLWIEGCMYFGRKRNK